MASHPLATDSAAQQSSARVYSLCFFDPGLVVPRVKLVEAFGDEEAIETARSMYRFAKREVWLRHRLVGVLRPES